MIEWRRRGRSSAQVGQVAFPAAHLAARHGQDAVDVPSAQLRVQAQVLQAALLALGHTWKDWTQACVGNIARERCPSLQSNRRPTGGAVGVGLLQAPRKLGTTTSAPFVFSAVTVPSLISRNCTLTRFVCVSQAVRESGCPFNGDVWAPAGRYVTGVRQLKSENRRS